MQTYFTVTDVVLVNRIENNYPKIAELLLASMDNTKSLNHVKPLCEVLYELLWRHLEGSISVENLISLLYKAKDKNISLLSSSLCDTLWLIGQECDSTLGYSDASKSALFVVLVKRIVADRVCALEDLKSRLEIDKLIACNLVTKAFFDNMKRINTQRYYVQHKFNLIRDENEGYSKLLVFLHEPTINQSTLSSTLSSYISLFNLDPNRVFDMILDACEFEKEKYPIFLTIFTMFHTEEIPHLLEFKLLYFKNYKEKKIPISFLELSMRLLRDQFISREFYKKILREEETELTEYAQKRTNEIYKTISTMRKFTAEIPKTSAKILPIPDNLNWPFLLIAACNHASLAVVVDLWQYVTDVGFNPCWSNDCSRALSRLLMDICSTVYSTISPFSSITQTHSKLVSKCRSLLPEDSISDVSHLLKHIQQSVLLLGPYIANEPYFYSILCRILAHVMRQKSPENLELQEIAFSMYKSILLRSLVISTPNPSINQEIWQGLQFFSQQSRFILYQTWQSEDMTKNPDLLFGMKRNYLGIDYCLRRLAVGNVDEMTKILTFFSYSCPIYLFRLLLQKCATYDNLIQLIVPKLKCISSLGIDVCCYCIIEFIQNRDNKIESDHITFEPGFDLSTSFASSFVKLFSERIDIHVMLWYVEKCVREGDLSSLLLISKLLTVVANIPSPRDMISPAISVIILRALSSSSTLVQATTRYLKVETSSKSRSRLMECLCNKDIMMTMLVDIPRVIGEMIWDSEMNDVTVLSMLFDRNLDFFVRMLMLFAHDSLYIQQFIELIPAPEQLLSRYHLEIPFAFALIRSVISIDDIMKKEGKWKITTPEFVKIHQSYYPENTWKILDYQSFLLFWCLDYHDICCPTECYTDYNHQIDAEIQISSGKKRERNATRTEVKKLTKIINRLKNEQSLLIQDQIDQQAHISKLGNLIKSCSNLFKSEDVKTCIALFIQYCLLPRIIMSPMDALFCAEFVRHLVQWEVKNYNHILFVKRVLIITMTMQRAVTSNQSLNISLFLLELFTDLSTWVDSETKYSKECYNNYVFAKNVNLPEDGGVTFESFTKFYKHWMKTISLYVVANLQSNNLQHVRHALDFLQRMSSVYPQKTGYGEALYPYLENLTFNPNGGIKTSAQMLCTCLDKLK